MTEDRSKIFETPYWEIFLNNDQLYLGRSVVLLKRDCGDLSGLSSEEATDFFEVVKKLESLMRETFNATMFNWTCMMNDAYKTKPPHPQVHWHCRPRYEHGVNLGEQTFEDPNFAHHYKREAEMARVVTGEVLSMINDALQEKLV